MRRCGLSAIQGAGSTVAADLSGNCDRSFFGSGWKTASFACGQNAAKASVVLPPRVAACAGEPDGSCMARIVDKLRCPGNILRAKLRDFQRRRHGPALA